MVKELVVANFDYSVVEGEAKGKLQRLASYVNKAIGKQSDANYEIGEHVKEAHAILAGEGREGLFKTWVELECKFSRQHAYNLMSVLELFGKCKNFLHFFDQTAAIEIAKNSTPKKAQAKAMKLAEKGHYISFTDAKKIIKECKPEPEPEPEEEEEDEPPEILEVDESEEVEAEEEEETEEEATPDPVDLSSDERAENDNKVIESFCRSLVKFYEDKVPDTVWINEAGRVASALASVKAGCETLRSTKSVVCPGCKGEGTGCTHCKEYGYLPKFKARMVEGVAE